jgi:hypothetical protein
MNRISSQALEWQKNHEDNGDGVTSNNEQWKEHDHVEKLWPLSLSPITPNSGSNVLDKFKIGIGYVVGCCQSSKFIFCGCVLLFVHYYLLHHQRCLCDSLVRYVFMVIFIYCCSPCWWLWCISCCYNLPLPRYHASPLHLLMVLVIIVMVFLLLQPIVAHHCPLNRIISWNYSQLPS